MCPGFGVPASACSGTSLTCTVTMDGNKNVTAQSRPTEKKKIVYLSFEDRPMNRFYVNGKLYDLYDNEKIPFYVGTKVVVTTTEKEPLKGMWWSGACSGLLSQPCTIIMDSDKNVGEVYKNPIDLE
jgi:hypothetical protein